MTERCPSSLALEAVLEAPGSAPAAAHARSCQRCRAQLQQMEREGDDFRQFVYPATLAAVLKPARTRLWWGFILGPAAVLATAALIIVARPGAPGEDYVGVKGGALKLSVFSGGAQSAHEVADRGDVRANAALRFRVQAASACQLLIVSIDETGQVSRLFPAVGEGGAPVQGLVTLPGGVELDGRAGPERVYAICTLGAMTMPQIERAVRESVGSGTQNVRAAGALKGLPKGSSQATLLLEKTP